MARATAWGPWRLATTWAGWTSTTWPARSSSRRRPTPRCAMRNSQNRPPSNASTSQRLRQGRPAPTPLMRAAAQLPQRCVCPTICRMADARLLRATVSMRCGSLIMRCMCMAVRAGALCMLIHVTCHMCACCPCRIPMRWACVDIVDSVEPKLFATIATLWLRFYVQVCKARIVL